MRELSSHARLRTRPPLGPCVTDIYRAAEKMILPCVAAEMCIRLLRNKAEYRILQKRPGHVSLWNAITGEFEQLEALKSNNTAFCSVNAINDLRGKTLVVATDLIYPFIIVNLNKKEVTGIVGDIWTILEETLKFKYALFVRSDGAIDTKWWYINTFSRDLWLAFSITIVCIACSIAGVYRVKKLVHVHYEECDDELSSMSFNLLHVLSFGQGFQKIPKSMSLRLIILSSLVMGMLMTCGFSSNLASCLANKGNSVSLTNLEDVAKKRTHSLCIRNDSTAYVHFTVDGLPESDLQDKWKKLLNRHCPDMSDTEALASKLCRRGFAYLEAPSIFLPIYRKVQHECDIVQLPDDYWSLKLTFLHARAARHRKLIDSYLMRMRSVGIMNYLEKKWISQRIYSESNYRQSNSFQPVEYMHVRLTNMFFFTTMIISVLICILENIWYKLQHTRKFKKNISNSILLGRGDNNLNITKSYKIRSQRKWHRKFNSILLSESIKNPKFLRNVTVRINRW
ncbi:uncharacterized protein LOC143903334 isoform X3 [Temnothorax americanus]|uniref:uncharacterized protein LOC143903334 isoform X3 n=1 Tax=Temnothorax americanus TaxID=1964332 RepID=UPI004067DD23